MPESYWFTTRSTLFRPGDAAWEEVARYEAPLRRLLRRRYGWLPEEDREDLAQDVLLEIKETLTASFERSRGRFRALLTTVVKRRVVDWLRRARPRSLDPEAAAELAAPPDDELQALDLEALLLEAVTACRDRFTQGPERDPDVLYALVDRLVHGKSNQEIAHAAGVSRDRVQRLLRRGRDAIFEHLLRVELELDPDDARLTPALEAFKRCLRAPREATAALDAVGDERLAAALDELLTRLRAALRRFEGDESVEGRELARGVGLILG